MHNNTDIVDLTLVGGGIMSLTLAVLISEIYPDKKIKIIERLSQCGQESSNVLNNAGTGHASYCELNYTPMDKKGEVNIGKAIQINESFEKSLEFLAYLDTKYKSFNLKKFLKVIPHISFVWGEDNTNFLKKRFNTLKKQPLFKEMEFSENHKVISKWAPLIIEGRDKKEKVAATRIKHGTDINFSALINELFLILKTKKNFQIELDTEIKDIEFLNNETYKIITKNKKNKKNHVIHTKKIFVGAGGMSISLLHKIGVKEIKGYAGFPLSGKWLISENKELIKKHSAKVYSQAFKNAPPMSIPHLDIRSVDNTPILMFGPFAGITTKYLKNGSFIDFFKSIRSNNLYSLLYVAINNFSLLKYLISQSLMGHNKKMKQLKAFFPNSNNKDWVCADAGIRVQIIKKGFDNKVKLEFGTEIVFSNNNSLAGLIGASPGASTACFSMIQIIEKFYKDKLLDKKIKKIIPSYNLELNQEPLVLKKIRTKTYKKLGLW